MRKQKKIICGLLLPLLFGGAVGVRAPAYRHVEPECVSAAREVTIRDVRVSSRIWELFFGGEDKGEAAPVSEPVAYEAVAYDAVAHEPVAYDAVAYEAMPISGASAYSGTDLSKACAYKALPIGNMPTRNAVLLSSEALIPGGDVFGAKIRQGHVTVTEDNRALGIKCGDILLKVDGKEVKSVSDVRALVLCAEGGSVKLTLGRGDEILERTATLDGEDKHLGIVIRDGAAGIGTITYIDPEDMSFGGLGHGICDSESGEIVEMQNGCVTGVILGGVHKGEKGHPGELSGILTDRERGVIYDNTDMGVFGKIDPECFNTGATLPIGHRDEVKPGAATMISTVKNGKKAEYAIEIFDIDSNSSGTKCFKVRVTDPTLLALTGGIVRGMSGSPIIQDGKLIGAVTHVMVADPTEGYGIFIENMLKQEDNIAMPKAA